MTILCHPYQCRSCSLRKIRAKFEVCGNGGITLLQLQDEKADTSNTDRANTIHRYASCLTIHFILNLYII